MPRFDMRKLLDAFAAEREEYEAPLRAALAEDESMLIYKILGGIEKANEHPGFTARHVYVSPQDWETLVSEHAIYVDTTRSVHAQRIVGAHVQIHCRAEATTGNWYATQREIPGADVPMPTWWVVPNEITITDPGEEKE